MSFVRVLYEYSTNTVRVFYELCGKSKIVLLYCPIFIYLCDMRINFYIDSFKRMTGESSIYCYVRINNVTMKHQTGQSVPRKAWDNRKQVVKSTYTASPEINTYLVFMKEDLKKLITSAYNEERDISIDKVKAIVAKYFNKNEPDEKYKSIFDLFDKFVNSQKVKVSAGTVEKYNVTKKHLENFEKKMNYKITLDSFDLSFYDLFTQYSINQLKHSDNTLGKNLKVTKTFLNWATERGYNKKLDYQKFKAIDKDGDIIYLTEEELMKLFYLDLSEDKTLDKARDIFLMSCFTGQRFSDVYQLKQEDVKDGIWHLHVVKTHEPNLIPFNDYAYEILRKYSDKNEPFPKMTNQRLNGYIKEIGEKAEINEQVTLYNYSGGKRQLDTQAKYKFMSSHCGRRTFCTLSLQKGMRPEIVMKISGHKDYKTFKRYVKLTSVIIL